MRKHTQQFAVAYGSLQPLAENTERRGKRLEDLAGADRSDHVRCVETVARIFS